MSSAPASAFTFGTDSLVSVGSKRYLASSCQCTTSSPFHFCPDARRFVFQVPFLAISFVYASLLSLKCCSTTRLNDAIFRIRGISETPQARILTDPRFVIGIPEGTTVVQK
ncbi:hypothetical protein BU26DRAFT_516622 [Trematosphaeria pertusa]|uniref:Uncharacterized protein n=1 Tax=Trematosphaeria pertusa TaxID=390896 RepID=A0A6A6IQM8_9PLEO|nr:uncharacterized protein BU26DRAFT_516622 [Trematosphaeria pertusa]KAF2251880.1 hypothetical protein BU26DRAFT_516622 [Trematosphaeria pertusa]